MPQLEKKVNDSESRFISELVSTRSLNSNNENERNETDGESYSVGGNALGIPLNETLIVQNNFSEVLSIFVNGQFTFIQRVQNMTNFYVTILKNPAGRTCVVQNGIGKIENSNFNGVLINCI
ncbi:hypothetical protein EHQ46_15830 [Leptospira yanagawae]|uniref:Uncharacterized protein n=1 Tax=Leptospira yanagawae TaxID=293069 RepID=A0ABY2LXX2_9LEPT|nr:hypothetical protein [Leptospira yanagawae]TGL17924.1 hypothetical protein EHQ46_15830 [Leptospira yanagawae]